MLELTKADVFPAAVPLPTLPPVMPLPMEAMPPCIQAYIQDAAYRIGCPPDFLAVAAITALATAVGRKRMIRGKKHDNWKVVPCIWGMVIGRPSSMKSPAIKAALIPLDELEIRLGESHRQEMRLYNLEKRLQKMQESGQERSAKQALKEKGIDAARSILSAADDPLDAPPTRTRLVVNDSTIEKLQELLVSNPNGLLLLRDELGGLIARLESEEFAEQRSFLLLAHSGQTRFVVDRIQRGTIDVEAACVSLLGGVQPARVARLVKGAVSGQSDDGLLQRFQLTVWPDDQGAWAWRDSEPCEVAKKAYESIFIGMYELEHLDEPLSLSECSYEIFKNWNIAMRGEVDSGDIEPALAAHILKAPEAVLSLALIFQLCADVQSLVVEEEAMRMAIVWAGYLRSHAQRLYHSQSISAAAGAQRLIKGRKALPELFSPRDIYRRNWANLGREEVFSALEMLVDYGHLHEISESTNGRPRKTYQWTS